VPSVSEHERRLRELPCIVSERRPVTLHHCHGGSLKGLGWHVGMAQRQNPFLQIPLHAEFHIGSRGIDSGTGVVTWENRYGSQLDHLREVDQILSYEESIFVLARRWEFEHRSKSGARPVDEDDDPGSEARLGGGSEEVR